MALAHAAAIALKTWLTLRTWHAVTNGPPTSFHNPFNYSGPCGTQPTADDDNDADISSRLTMQLISAN